MTESARSALNSLRQAPEVDWMVAIHPSNGWERVLYQSGPAQTPQAGTFALLSGIFSAAEALAGAPVLDLQINHDSRGLLAQAHPSGFHLVLSHNQSEPVGALKIQLKELAAQWEPEAAPTLTDPFSGLS